MLLERLGMTGGLSRICGPGGEEVGMVVSQYRRVVGALDIMFKEMDLRSEVMFWRWDGVGTCRGVDLAFSEKGMVGIAKKELIELRNNKSREYPKTEPVCSCPYHRKEIGCVLGDLKGPICIGHIDFPKESEARFGIDGSKLSGDIKWILQTILNQGQDRKCRLEDGTISTEEFVGLSVGAVEQMTKHVERFPILSHEDRKSANYTL